MTLLIVTTALSMLTPHLSRRDLAAVAVPAVAAFNGPVPAAFAQTAAATLPFTQQNGFKLNTGTNFPTASFGLQVYDDKLGEELTLIALEAGYRNFFASVLARNQKGFARAVKKSGVPREELFICGSVLSNQVQGFDAARKLSARECAENLEAFAVGGIDYVDMIMLDYPGPDADSIRGQWAALEEMAKQGTTRSLAVSNFSPRQLDVILADPKATVPTVNQLPYGVGFASYYDGKAATVVAENAKRGVLVQAWSPLQRALRGRNKAICAEIGSKYGKTAAQVALRWIEQTGVTYTTAGTRKKDGAAARFAENIGIFDFKLTAEEMATLAAL